MYIYLLYSPSFSCFLLLGSQIVAGITVYDWYSTLLSSKAVLRYYVTIGESDVFSLPSAAWNGDMIIFSVVFGPNCYRKRKQYVQKRCQRMAEAF